MSFKPQKSMCDLWLLAFFGTKKNPAKGLLMYLFMADLSGPESVYSHPLEGKVPGSRSITQLYDLCYDCLAEK